MTRVIEANPADQVLCVDNYCVANAKSELTPVPNLFQLGITKPMVPTEE
jgi:hypothetical protein